MGWVAGFAVISGVGQAVGYLLYIRHMLRHETRPNAASAFMFGYGTALLAVIEHDNGAGWPLLLLPVTCALLGVVVAALCLRRGIAGRVDPLETMAFSVDLVLTAVYLGVWLIKDHGAISSRDGDSLALAFLIAVNATSATSFAPLIRSTWQEPQRERPMPWLVWTGCYALLAGITVADAGGRMSTLLIYPIFNVGLHFLIAIMALRPVPSHAATDAS